jgi:hypothetical protein
MQKGTGFPRGSKCQKKPPFFRRSSREMKPEREAPETSNSLKLAGIKNAERGFTPGQMSYEDDGETSTFLVRVNFREAFF